MPYEAFLNTRLFEPLGMKDTTFWPNKAQIARLAKSYQPNADSSALVETPVTQLNHPLDDRARQPMPAGGLFSTAADLTRFCQMVLGGGVYKGKRYVSEAAVRQMTSVQTGDLPLNGNDGEGYGFGWTVRKKASADGPGAGSFGHGGAYKTMMRLDPQKELILILLRQHAGPDGNKVEPAFLKAAYQKYAK
jgi:CubicO group peptidase (beta-lactamase class C family)